MATVTAPLGRVVLFTAPRPPGATDDWPTIGARAGYPWQDSSEPAFWFCISAASGAAVWQKLPQIGTQGDQVARVAELGSAAFVSVDDIRGIATATHNAAYQILPQDFGGLLLCTSGTQTWTMAAEADLPRRWWCRIKNRSGNGLTLNFTGSDTINAGAASLTIATAATALIVRAGTGTFESY